VQRTDAGRCYHKGIQLAVEAMGKQKVPGVPKTVHQGRDLMDFVQDLIVSLTTHKNWCASP